MAESRWARHALGIGLFEFRRSVRAIRRDKARLGMMALAVVGPSAVLTALLAVFASEIRGIGPLSVPNAVRGMVALFWLFAVFIVGQRMVSAHAHVEAESMMLTSVSARAVAGGLVVAETLRVLAYVGLYAVVGTAAAVLLFGSLASLVLVPTTTVLFAATAVVAATACGYAVAWLIASSPFVARHKTVLGIVAALALMGVYLLFIYSPLGIVSPTSLAWLPMAWFVDLATTGSPFVGSPIRAAGALLGSLLLVVVGGALVEREAVALWFTEPVNPDADGATRETVDSGAARFSHRGALAAAVSPLVVPDRLSTPTRRVAEWTLLRTRRDPNRTTFLLVPVFAIGSSLVSSGYQSGSVTAVAAPLCAVMLPWLAGALFALNPLGDEGRVLPMTLTTVPGRQYVRGLMTPGLLLGLPAVLVVTAVASVFSPYTLVRRIETVVLGGALTVIAVAIAPAVGMAFPRFSAISVGRSDDVLPPRMTAVFVHLVAVVVPGGLLVLLTVVPGLTRGLLGALFGSLPALLLGLLAGSPGGPVSMAAGWFDGLGDAIRALDLVQLQVVTSAVLLVVGFAVALSLYRNAISRFERFSPP
ncbi:hypothetical protein [Halococcus hamelinensis]|uniref:ABC-2 type transport system permease protein n=1 Tax=Halococcus hamelinensis 100A6 TaxID=1132509 RepID=M0LXN3_9EURY|nr:hypothetical protein [Halococcus hamelinensis]EMA38352.1 hypothetical protein C447_09357 [Halococcus hamelinensis 100A6]